MVLRDSETIHVIPAGHCGMCHATYYDGRVVMDEGYITRLYELLGDCVETDK